MPAPRRLRPICLSLSVPFHCTLSKGEKREGDFQEEKGGRKEGALAALSSSSHTTKRGGRESGSEEQKGERAKEGERASAEWRTGGGCLEQSWLMRALQLAAAHNSIKEEGGAGGLATRSSPSRHRRRPTFEWSGWQLASSPLLSSLPFFLPAFLPSPHPSAVSLVFTVVSFVCRRRQCQCRRRGGGGISGGRHNTTQLLLLNTP